MLTLSDKDHCDHWGDLNNIFVGFILYYHRFRLGSHVANMVWCVQMSVWMGVGLVKVVPFIIGFLLWFKTTKAHSTNSQGRLNWYLLYVFMKYNSLIRQNICYFIVEHTLHIFYYSFLSKVPLRTSLSIFHYILSFDCGM